MPGNLLGDNRRSRERTFPFYFFRMLMLEDSENALPFHIHTKFDQTAPSNYSARVSFQESASPS